MMRLVACGLAVCALAVPAALAGRADTPGVTPDRIVIGGTAPLSGPAVLFASVAKGAEAYFEYVNRSGGVFGRTIDYRYLDDGYDPARTVQMTRQLVEQDKVLAIFNSVGTPNGLVVRDYLNASGVPQLFQGSGVASMSTPRVHWSMGFLPSFVGEGRVYGRRIAATKPKAKIAVLYENNDFGKNELIGLRSGLGARAKQIVSAVPYEVTDTELSSQISRLKASGADTLVLFATPQFAILSYVAAQKLGWKPQFYLSFVSPSPNVMDIIRASVGKLVNGTISVAFVKDPTNRKLWGKDPAIALYKKVLACCLAGGKYEDVYNYYGMAVAYTMVDALKGAGRNPTRESLMAAAARLNEVNPFLLPGIRVKTSKSDYKPIQQAQIVRYSDGTWIPVGKLVGA
jgi:branched-chain amino acid transport system substrate-binding protein